uniref:Putative protease n=1 Tax=viral metagenome TaxID=1070528 RepID=A0A6M3LQB4_9ZZZZ
MRDWTDEWDVTSQAIWTHIKRLILPAAIVLSLAVLAAIVLNGCGTVPINPVPFPPQELKIKVEGGTVEKDKDKISKSMSVNNPELQFSRNCYLHENKAYISITSISSYDAKDLWSDLKLLRDKKVDEIIIYMNNPGGEVFQGMSITDELRIFKDSGIPITVEGRGLIASAAIPVFLIADKRICSKYTVFMLHPAAIWKWGVFTEELKDLKSQASMIELLNEHYAESVSSSSNLSKDEVLEFLKSTTWFTAEQAKGMKFVDIIQ